MRVRAHSPPPMGSDNKGRWVSTNAHLPTYKWGKLQGERIVMPKENEVVKELDDVEEEKDFFEKLLEEEIDPLAGESEDGEGTDPKNEKSTADDKSAEENKEDDESVESLKAKIAEMERERKGQLDSVVKSRQERARFKSELSELKGAVETLLAQRGNNALADEEKEEEKAPLTDPRAEVKFEENGDSAYVDLSEVKKAIAAETTQTREELEALKEERAIEEAKQAFAENVGSVINENKELYGEAYKQLGTVYEDLNNKIIELQVRTGEAGEDGVLSQDRAIELFTGSPEEQEFLKEHPGIDPTRVARAFNTKVDLKASLKHLVNTKNLAASADKEPEGGLDEKLKQAKEKPGGLGGQSNRNAEDTGDLVTRISRLSNEDVEDLSDAEVAKIEQMLLREELNSN